MPAAIEFFVVRLVAVVFAVGLFAGGLVVALPVGFVLVVAGLVVALPELDRAVEVEA